MEAKKIMYTVTIKDGKKIISGTYIPNDGTCKCKECKFMIEVPQDTSDIRVSQLMEMVRK